MYATGTHHLNFCFFRYLEILQKQRHEMEDLMAQKLRDQERDLTNQTFAAVQEKDNSIQSVLKTALDAQQQEHEEHSQVPLVLRVGEVWRGAPVDVGLLQLALGVEHAGGLHAVVGANDRLE